MLILLFNTLSSSWYNNQVQSSFQHKKITTKKLIIPETIQNCAMAEPMPGCKLFVGNITERVQKHQLRSDFEKFGRVNEVFIGQGFGFITFDRPG